MSESKRDPHTRRRRQGGRRRRKSRAGGGGGGEGGGVRREKREVKKLSVYYNLWNIYLYVGFNYQREREFQRDNISINKSADAVEKLYRKGSKMRKKGSFVVDLVPSGNLFLPTDRPSLCEIQATNIHRLKPFPFPPLPSVLPLPLNLPPTPPESFLLIPLPFLLSLPSSPFPSP